MANRHLARSIAMQTLFELDFRDMDQATAADAVNRNIEQFAPGMEENVFVEEIVGGVLKKQKVIDEIIEKAAPEWPLDKIANVDRNVLRIGLYELLFGDRENVPPKVAINEAIELAKQYGGENSGRFVNGVLGAVYKEIGEPGKDQTTPKKKKKSPEPVDLESLPIELKAGGVVYAEHEGETYLAMVHDVFGYWTLAKGGIEDGESAEEGAAREILEEINLSVMIEALLGENEYIANHPTKGKIRKQVKYFLAKGEYAELKLEEDSGGLDDVRWFRLDEVPGLTMYDDIVQMITKAIEIIMKEE